jgi:8-oxo-dGTP diphosphatase/2-hydroxy-dATP diphosphatase
MIKCCSRIRVLMNIYFAASIRGGRSFASHYPAIVDACKRHGTVLSEHFALEALKSDGEDLPEKFIHDRDMGWVLASDVVVAEVTVPSLGVGYEIGRAIENGKRVLCLYQPQPGKKLSGMILGSDRVTVRAYHDKSEAEAIIDEYFAASQNKVLTLVLVHDRGRVLLGKKKRGFGTGKWNGFGGKVEANETIESGARRELLEEAGIGTVSVERRGRILFHFAGDPVTLEMHVFRARSHSGTPEETAEMTPQWFGEDEIPYETMWPDSTQWLPLFLANKRFEGEFWYSGEHDIEKYDVREV